MRNVTPGQSLWRRIGRALVMVALAVSVHSTADAAPTYATVVTKDVVFSSNVTASTTSTVTVASASRFEVGQYARTYLRCSTVPGCNVAIAGDTLQSRTVQIMGVSGNTLTIRDYNADPDTNPSGALNAAPAIGSAFESILHFVGNSSWFAGGGGQAAGLYVADFYNNRIVVFNADGTTQKVIGRFGSPWRQDDTSVYFVPDGDGGYTLEYLYFPKVDGTCYDVIYQPRTTCSHNQWTDLGTFYAPSDVEVAADGTVYVMDTWNYRIQVLTPNASGTVTASDGSKYSARAIGGRSDSPSAGTFGSVLYAINPGVGFLSSPFGLAVTTTGDVWVADTSNDRVQYFRRVASGLACNAGEVAAGVSDVAGPGYCIKAFGSTGEGLNSQAYEFDLPIDVAIDKTASGSSTRGRLAVADSDNNRVHIYDPAVADTVDPTRPKLIAIIGRSDSRIGSGVPNDGIADGWTGPEFNDPWAVTFDSAGRLFVADALNHRLQIFDPAQNGYTFNATVGAQEGTLGTVGLNFPLGVSVTSTGSIYVTESGKSRMQRLGIASLAIGSGAVGQVSTIVNALSTASFTVTNTGEVPLANVLPTVTGDLSFDLVSMTPSLPVTLAAGAGASASQSYVLTFTPRAPGTLRLTAAVSGSASGGASVSATNLTLPSITVTPLPVPSVSLQALTLNNATAGLGSPVIATARVTNTGGATLYNVQVTIRSTNGSGSATGSGAETTTLSGPLAPQMSADVMRTFTATSVGQVAFSATATGCAPTQATCDLSSSGDKVIVNDVRPAANGKPILLTVVNDVAPPAMTAAVLGPTLQAAPCRYVQIAGGAWTEACGTAAAALGLAPSQLWFRYPRMSSAVAAEREPVRVVLTASDETGLRSIAYQANTLALGSGTFTPAAGVKNWTQTLNVTGEGQHLLAFWAVDTSGTTGNAMPEPTPAERANIGLFCARVPTQCVAVNIDPLAPVLNEVPPLTISADNTQASIAFTASDGHSTVARIFIEQNNCTAAQPNCVRIEQPTSQTQGQLVLTSEGTAVQGDITVIDAAGHKVKFSLPFEGQGPALRLDRTPPELFNRIDSATLGSSTGATCQKRDSSNVLLFTYLCSNQVYATDNLPGMPATPVAPLTNVAATWASVDNPSGESGFTGTAETHTTQITDEFVPTTGAAPLQNPNRVELVEKVRMSGKEIRVRVVSFRYATGSTNGTPNWGPTVMPSVAFKKYTWTVNTNGSLKTLTQKYELWAGTARVQVVATYTASTNKTVVVEKAPQVDLTQTFTGLTLLRMTTAGGTLKIQYSGKPAEVDITPPTLNLPAAITVDATSQAGGAPVTFNVWAVDTMDGFTPVTCNWTSGSTFPNGTTTVNCSTVDTAGRTATGSFSVTVRPLPPPDTTPPVLTLPAPIARTISSGTGTTVTYTASATDAVSGATAVTCTPASGSVFPIGATTVTCTSTDSAGNTATGTFTVTVTLQPPAPPPDPPADTTPPVITVPANMSVSTSSSSGTTVTFTATAVDAVSGTRPVTCTPASGTNFSVATTTVTCSATDAAGNSASKTFTVTVTLVNNNVARVRLAPDINGTSVIEGSIHMMTGENINMNGNARITGELRVPGTPNVQINGSVNYGGLTAGTGSTSPTGYTLTMNTGTTLGQLVSRTNPVTLPTIATPATPSGTRTVTLNSSSDPVGTFSTVKDLTINSGTQIVLAVPAGTYGQFTANGNNRFQLGVAGASTPSVYNFQQLTLNTEAAITIVGPVVINVRNQLDLNSSGFIGSEANPSWLTMNISSAGLTLNSASSFYGKVVAPTGMVTINGGSKLIGGLIANDLTLNTSGLLRLTIAP